jgi:hypothetical protein
MEPPVSPAAPTSKTLVFDMVDIQVKVKGKGVGGEVKEKERDWVTGLGPDDVINSQGITHFPTSGSVDVRSPRFEGMIFPMMSVLSITYISSFSLLSCYSRIYIFSVLRTL